MNVTICPSEALISSSTALRRSSNSPRYLAPATMAPRSREIRVLPRRDSGTSPATMRWARPSTTAVLPTPGSPMSTGLFLVRRESTWIDAADLAVAADDRVQLARAGNGGHVGAELLQRLEGVFGIRVVDLAVPADSGQRGLERLAGGAEPAQDVAGGSGVVAEPQQQVLGGNVGVAEASAACWAALMVCRMPREYWAWATEFPEEEGRALMAALACTETWSGSMPAALSKATATDSRWSISALSR